MLTWLGERGFEVVANPSLPSDRRESGLGNGGFVFHRQRHIWGREIRLQVAVTMEIWGLRKQ